TQTVLGHGVRGGIRAYNIEHRGSDLRKHQGVANELQRRAVDQNHVEVGLELFEHLVEAFRGKQLERIGWDSTCRQDVNTCCGMEEDAVVELRLARDQVSEARRLRIAADELADLRAAQVGVDEEHLLHLAQCSGEVE